MNVLVTSKNKEDPNKNEDARVVLEILKFENVIGRTDGRTPARLLYYKLTL